MKNLLLGLAASFLVSVVVAADGARARGVQSSTNKAVTAVKFGDA